MKAIILAAGEGKRLRPLTLQKPKCMVKLFGKTLLEWQIKTFQSVGISDISVITGYQNQHIQFNDIKYFHNQFFDQTNMVETLFCAEEEINGSVIISYGDIIFEKELLLKLIENDDDIAIIIDKNWKKIWEKRFTNPLEDAESLSTDENWYINDIGQKISKGKIPKGQYIGLMKFQNEGVNNMKKFYHESKIIAEKNGINPLNSELPFQKSYMTDFLRGLILNGSKIKGIPIENKWLELDTTEDYNLYNRMYNDGTISEFIEIGKMD